MSLTLTNTSPPNYTVTVSGTLLFEKISIESGIYTLKAKNLPGGIADFEFEIPEAEAETSGNIDPVKVFIWIINKAKKALCPECE